MSDDSHMEDGAPVTVALPPESTEMTESASVAADTSQASEASSETTEPTAAPEAAEMPVSTESTESAPETPVASDASESAPGAQSAAQSAEQSGQWAASEAQSAPATTEGPLPVAVAELAADGETQTVTLAAEAATQASVAVGGTLPANAASIAVVGEPGPEAATIPVAATHGDMSDAYRAMYTGPMPTSIIQALAAQLRAHLLSLSTSADIQVDVTAEEANAGLVRISSSDLALARFAADILVSQARAAGWRALSSGTGPDIANQRQCAYVRFEQITETATTAPTDATTADVPSA